MTTATPSYNGHRYPVEIINHCVWLYFRFPLSFREVEELMLVRGVAVSYETIRRWCAKFGQAYANQLRHSHRSTLVVGCKRCPETAVNDVVNSRTLSSGRNKALDVDDVLMPSTPSAYPQVVSRRFASSIPLLSQLKSIFEPGSIPGSATRRAADQAPVEVPHPSAAVPGAGVAALHPKLAVPLRRRQSKSNM